MNKIQNRILPSNLTPVTDRVEEEAKKRKLEDEIKEVIQNANKEKLSETPDEWIKRTQDSIFKRSYLFDSLRKSDIVIFPPTPNSIPSCLINL